MFDKSFGDLSVEERRAFFQDLRRKMLEQGMDPEMAGRFTNYAQGYPPEPWQLRRIQELKEEALRRNDPEPRDLQGQLIRKAREVALITHMPPPANYSQAEVQMVALEGSIASYARMVSADWARPVLDRLHEQLGERGEDVPFDQPDGSPWTSEAWRAFVLSLIEPEGEQPGAGS